MKTKTNLLFRLAFIVVCFNLLVFPFFSRMMSGLTLLDTDFFYKPHEALELFEALGPAGRRRYLRLAGIADMIYPAVYGSLFVLFAQHIKAKKPTMMAAWAAPIFDLSENLATVIMLFRFPRFDYIIALTGSFLNGFKWLTVAIYLLLTVATIFSARTSSGMKRKSQRGN